MKHLSPSLLVLAALVPTAAALEVTDADLKLGLVVQIQARAEFSNARGNDGNSYNVAESAANTPGDTADFYLRRFRIGFAGSYKDDYRFKAIVRLDAADRTGDSTTTNSGSTAVTAKQDPTNRVGLIHQASMERVFKTEGGLEHTIMAGLDYAFFNTAATIYPSASYLLVTDRPTASTVWLAPRGVGVGYKLGGRIAGLPYVWGANIQNNQGDDNNAYTGYSGGASTNNQKGEGLAYTNRFQMVLMDSDAKGHMKPVESFIGAPGTGILAGVEAGINRNDNTSATTTQNLKAEGIDILVHKDGLTAFGELRWRQLHSIGTTVADTNVAGRAIVLQAGYAVAMGTTWIEPAVRWSRINQDQSNSENDAYGSMTNAGMDYGSSGFETNIGVNWYLNKANNKVSIAYQNWRGEGGSTPAAVGTSEKPANANIVRIQWGLAF